MSVNAERKRSEKGLSHVQHVGRDLSIWALPSLERVTSTLKVIENT